MPIRHTDKMRKSMNELLVIIGAELILLVSIVAMMIHNRRADVLSRRCPDETDYAISDSSRAKQARRRVEREELRSQAVPAPEQNEEASVKAAAVRRRIEPFVLMPMILPITRWRTKRNTRNS
ncbi:hypothetical protein [Bradyrhizobium canariense]|uniref:Uncharacterized protein n=1 Tax=Bradyrhizobium canariense TaxID=255045 RepID=A0A1H1WS95_9BRAD|nr:hypothetical protein [Bradyrhizobium canariense]SDS99912.1 hypothetical protein SAMN05444158_3987 [Bradyrhizobium canariense]